MSPREDGSPSVIGWRAWYSGGRVFDSHSTRWVDLPSAEVLGVMIYEETMTPKGTPTRRCLINSDWYWYDGLEFGITTSIWDDWVKPPDVPALTLKRGGKVPFDEYESVRQAMMKTRAF